MNLKDKTKKAALFVKKGSIILAASVVILASSGVFLIAKTIEATREKRKNSS